MLPSCSTFFFFFLLTGLAACQTSNTYYVDSVGGHDSYSGRSPEKAWKSLEKVNQQVFQPGDKILFYAGTNYNGQLKPQGNGTEEAPIIIDRYGEGVKPSINGKGQYEATLLLENVP